jgi:hypothetical protein
MRSYGFNSVMKILLSGWSICVGRGGHFRSQKGGQFASAGVVILNRYGVITLIVFSIQALDLKLAREIIEKKL